MRRRSTWEAIPRDDQRDASVAGAGLPSEERTLAQASEVTHIGNQTNRATPATPPAVARVSDSAPTRVSETHPCRRSAPRALRRACSHRVACRLLRLLPREAIAGRDGGSAPDGCDAQRAMRTRL